MKSIVELLPFSKQGVFLCQMKINEGKNRIRVCAKKIHHLHWQSSTGEVAAIVQLQRISLGIQQALGYFEKEKKTLEKAIKKSSEDRVASEPTKTGINFIVSNRINDSLLQLIKEFDQLCWCLEVSHLKGIMNSGVMHSKKDQYWKPMINLVMLISQTPYNLKNDKKELSADEVTLLRSAMRNKKMPNFSPSMIKKLLTWVGKASV